MVCIIDGPLNTCLFDVASYVIYGIVLFIVGLILTAIVPIKIVKQVGLGMLVLGVVMAIGFSLVAELWKNSIVFQLITYSIGVLIVVLIILHPETPIPIKGK